MAGPDTGDRFDSTSSRDRMALSPTLIGELGDELHTAWRQRRGIVIEKNGQVIGTAAGAAVLGHPAASVAMLANMLAQDLGTVSLRFV